MFSRTKKINDISLKAKGAYSLEHLKHLYNLLIKNQIVTEQNKDLLIETLRLIAELLIYGDQNDPTLFDYFLEKNMLVFFISIAKQDSVGGKYLSVQLLQTLNILFENIRHETSLYYLLSNNHINTLIQHKFDFTEEEVTAYYITFLKTLSFKLNQHTIHFFINEHLNEFPLYTEAIKFYDNSESMVRIAVQTITLKIFSIQDTNASQHVAICSVSYFQSLANSLEKNIITITGTFFELNANIIEESQKCGAILNEELPKIYGGSVDNLTKSNSSFQLIAGDNIHSSVSSPSASPRIKTFMKNLNSEGGQKLNKSLSLLRTLEELITQHLDKLQYLDDIFCCKDSSSPLCVALGEILSNTVFVPLYLFPFIIFDHKSQGQVHINKNDEEEELPPPYPRLPINLAIFLLIQCVRAFSNHKDGQLVHSSKNFVIQQLLQLMFRDKSPTQSIMHRVGMKPARQIKSSQYKDVLITERRRSEGVVLKADRAPSFDSCQDPPDSKDNADIIDASIYHNIRPDDRLSLHYLTLNSKPGKTRPTLTTSSDTTTTPNTHLSIIYQILLKTLDIGEDGDSQIFQADSISLLTLTLFLKLLSDESTLVQTYLYSSTEFTPLHEATHKGPQFPYTLPQNMKSLLEKCVQFIELSVKTELEKMRLYTFYSALNIFNGVMGIISKQIKSENPDPQLRLMDPIIYNDSQNNPSQIESQLNPVPTYQMIQRALSAINSLYSYVLEIVVKRFKMDDNMFLDIFENQYHLVSSLNFPSKNEMLEDSMFDTSSPILLLNLNGFFDKNAFLNVYKLLLSATNGIYSKISGTSLFWYRRVNGIVEKVKMEVAIFLLLRKLLDILNEYLPYLTHLIPISKSVINEIATDKSSQTLLSYGEYFKDFSASCLLPKIGDVIDLSTLDIISCSIEKHLSQDMPYWFLVVADNDFALVVPHHKKMAHGIIKYVGPLKDIEVAGVTGDPRSLYVRIHRLFNGDQNELGIGNKKSKFADNQGSFHTLFKAKLSFEDVIRCQAAKNCLLKGRVRCRRSKTRLLGKMLYAADPTYLSASFKSFLPRDDTDCSGEHEITALKPATNSPIVPSCFSSTTTTLTQASDNRSESYFTDLNDYQGNTMVQSNSFIKPHLDNSGITDYRDDIPLKHLGQVPLKTFYTSRNSSVKRVLPSIKNYPEASQNKLEQTSTDQFAVQSKDIEGGPYPRRVMPTIPGSARPQQSSPNLLKHVYSPNAIRRITTNRTRPPLLDKCDAGYSTERFVKSLENHSDEDDYILYPESPPPDYTSNRQPRSRQVSPKHNTFLDHIFSRSSSQGSNLITNSVSFDFPSNASRNMTSSVKCKTHGPSHISKSNIKDL